MMNCMSEFETDWGYFFYLILIKIYEIVISKIKMILYEHYHRFEIIQNYLFQSHLNSIVSKNMFKA